MRCTAHIGNGSPIPGQQHIHTYKSKEIWLEKVFSLPCCRYEPSIQTPSGYWDDFANHRVFFDWLGEKLAIDVCSCWYHVKKEEISSHGGGGLLSLFYSGSSVKSLMTVYPDTCWQPWRFERVPDGFWYKVENQLEFMEWVAQDMEITHMDKWHQVKVHRSTIILEINCTQDASIYEKGGGRLLHHHYGDSLAALLQTVYPEHKFYPWLFQAKLSSDWWYVHLFGCSR